MLFEACEGRVLLAGSGFSGTYYNNADLTSPVISRTDTAIDFNWGKGSPDLGIDPSTFSVRWTGYIKPTYSETYTFYATADDGVRLKVNGQTIIDRWTDRASLPGDANNDGIVNFADFQIVEKQLGSSAAQSDFNHDNTVNSADLKLLYANYGKTLAAGSPTDIGTITLAAGQTYDLSLEYYQNADQSNVKLEWESASQVRELVPGATPDPVVVGGDGSGTGDGTGGGGTGGGPIILGSGNGLLGTYYDNKDFTGAQVSRVDPTVSFRWQGQRPVSSIDTTTFSVRWEGQVEAPVTGAYTFYVNSDDGSRLWVNDQLIMDVWGDKTESEYPSDPITLQAGQKYNIVLEYYQNEGDSVAELRWGGAVPKQIIPTSQLFPAAGPVQPPIYNPAPTLGGLQVSADGHFLVRSDGSQFFWLADTAWALFNKTTRTDVDTYLQNRADKEFTVTMAVLYNPDTYQHNAFNQPVFLNNNPSLPNPDYFTHVDYVLSKAQALGMYVDVLPTWGDAVASSTPFFNTTSAYNYGQWLGTRYATQPNIIWNLGGDTVADTDGIRAIWRSLAAGLAAGDGGTHLITFHPYGGKSSTTYWPQTEPWMAFNELQSGHTRDSANYNLVASDYAKSPAKPIEDAEPNYENIPNGLNPANPPLDAYDVRKKTYWALFAGAFGATYGNYEMYRFYTGSDPGQLPWQQAMNYPGAGQMRYAKRLMLSRPYLGRVPDQTLVTSGTLSGSDHIQATRASNGSYAFIYSASGQTFTVDLTKLAGTTITASWYDPRTGNVTAAGTVDRSSGTQSFTPPSSGYGNDWILVLDDASVGYNDPGLVSPGADLTGSVAGSVSDANGTIPYRLFRPTGLADGQKAPLILFLHGIGDRGTDNLKQLEWMGGLIKNTKSGPYAAYVLAPQIDTHMWFSAPADQSPTVAMQLTMEALQQVMATENVDTSRIYVTGNSMGAMGVWDIMYREPTVFAAAVPMSGGGDTRTAATIKDIPVWAFHGSADPLVPVTDTRNMISALQAAGGNPKYTEIPNGGHVIWDPIYQDASHTLYPWMFAQSRPAPAPTVGSVSADPETAVVTPVTPPTPTDTSKTPTKPTGTPPVTKPTKPIKVGQPPFSVIPVKPQQPKKPIVRKSEPVFSAPPVKPKAAPAGKLSGHRAGK